MLAIKKSSQLISVLGNASNIKEQISHVKQLGIDRKTKSLLRECLLAAMNYESSSKINLDKSVTIIRKNDDPCEIASRSACFAAASAMKMKKWSTVEEMLWYAKLSPIAMTSSIKISSLAQQKKIDEALNELEEILLHEEAVFSTSNYSVSDEALDTLCQSIKDIPDTADKMKRFRNIQRLITKYGRRTSKSINELLYSPINVPLDSNSEYSRNDGLDTFVKTKEFETFVKKIPYMDDLSK